MPRRGGAFAFTSLRGDSQFTSSIKLLMVIMLLQSRRIVLLSLLTVTLFLGLYTFRDYAPSARALFSKSGRRPGEQLHVESKWRTLSQHYPVPELRRLPSGRARDIPKIQFDFSRKNETAEAKAIRLERRDAVKNAFLHTWAGYKKHAWMRDEVKPISGTYLDSFGGWAATLVDSLDTMWIMGLKDEFELAASATKGIDWIGAGDGKINVFETNIRYLGGLLSAYDLSGNEVLLKKAMELGEMLYWAFDTPNRMPATRWNWMK